MELINIKLCRFTFLFILNNPILNGLHHNEHRDRDIILEKGIEQYGVYELHRLIRTKQVMKLGSIL